MNVILNRTNALLACVIGLMVIAVTSCSRTRYLHVTAKDIAKLDTVYFQVFSHKFFQTSWIFYEKQVCQYQMYFLTEQTYTGVWHEKNDTIFVNFFDDKKISGERKLYRNQETGRLEEWYSNE